MEEKIDKILEKLTIIEGILTTKKKREVKPKERILPKDVEEVEAYIKLKGYTDVNAKKFWDYYAPYGWINRDGKPIKNWKMTLDRNWHGNGFDTQKPKILKVGE